ncbi:MAG: bifunctional diaminohydroxyphosphoribosylaminopyrimidine deaminase/5-amino-6-(5-phosphoribosylamino)uracil reductase RibD [Gemmatimonadota bacterium]|nr:bifunctional diaminohydroxyphosphoribosylaminopyrimidine deaminase/5-amino-6-(5-phosphoribosylamino)uracil reductase RibD [Gemmatimonadota bacterium]
MHLGSMDPWGSVSDSNPSRDAGYMRRAIELARKGWGQTAPNPMVGAVLVRDGEVVGEGYHERFGEEHAEVRAIAAAGERAMGATLYVTLEPCNHYGKTPPCTRAVIAAGISRVVAGIRDPNPIAEGGIGFLRAHGVAVDVEVESEEASELVAPFLHCAKSDRPFITLKLALSSDGAVADVNRKKKWLSGDDSRAEVHRLRAGADAIAVGAGTVISDDPALTVRGPVTPRLLPARVVFDRQAKIPLSSKLVRTAREVPTIVVTAKGATYVPRLRHDGVTVIEASDTRAAVEALHRAGIQHLFVEGGAGLSSDLLRAGLVDRLVIFQTDIPLGPGGVKPFERLEDLDIVRIVGESRFGDDRMTVYALKSK